MSTLCPGGYHRFHQRMARRSDWGTLLPHYHTALLCHPGFYLGGRHHRYGPEIYRHDVDDPGRLHGLRCLSRLDFQHPPSTGPETCRSHCSDQCRFEHQQYLC